MKAPFIAILIFPPPTTAFLPPAPMQIHTSVHSTVTEETYPSFLSSASACVNSDTCSIEMAEQYLREIVRIESACVAGTMAGEACGSDVARVSEIVVGLRDKIEGMKKGVGTFWEQRQDEFETLVSSSIDVQSNTFSPVAALTQAPMKPGYLAMAALYTVLVITLFQTNNSADVVPFTAHEIWWSIRDGYTADLLEAYLKHGGLLVSENGVGPVNSFTPQEIWWAIRDGYAHNLVTDWFRNGGGVSATEEFVAMTPQEFWWSLRDGYVSTGL